MNREEFIIAHEQHQKWLKDNSIGKRFEFHGKFYFEFKFDFKINLRDSDLRHSDFSGSFLRYSDFSGSDSRYSDFSGSDLSGSDFSGSDLRGSDLSNSDLKYSDLRGSDLRDSDLRGSDLDYSCWPLWCGSKNAKVGMELIYQLLAHVSALDCEDAEYLEIKNAIKKYAEKSHRWSSLTK
jgi:hypothetical protein